MSSGSNNFIHQSQLRMVPPHQPPRVAGLQASLSLVPSDAPASPNPQEPGSKSPTESASSRETWPSAIDLLAKKLDKEKEGVNDLAEHSVVHGRSGSDKMTLIDIAKDRVDIVSDRMQKLPHESIEALKNELRVILEGAGGSQHREGFFILQKVVQSRTDLTAKTLLRCHRVQLQILVAINTGILAFLHPRLNVSQDILIEIFEHKRCRNIACQSQLPSDDCKCEVCTTRKGFCNLCMCVICSKFDFEVNTFRWIGCDLCSHWTHTDCATRDGHIGVGPRIEAGSGPAGMFFRCGACNRTSDLYGWVKDVFQNCSSSWDREALMRELDFVSRIFRESEDHKGRKLYWHCEELKEKLKGGLAGPVACKEVLLFFQELEIDTSKSFEGGRQIAPQGACNQIADVVHEAVRKMEVVAEEKLRMFKKARLDLDACDLELEEKFKEAAELKMERQQKKQRIDELERIVRLKDAEADMFQLKASEARQEAERLRRIALAKSEKAEEEYASMYLKLRLNEAEAEKQHLFEKIKLQESSSRASHSSGGAGNDPSQMICKIQDLLKNVYDSRSKSEGQQSGLQSLGAIP